MISSTLQENLRRVYKGESTQPDNTNIRTIARVTSASHNKPIQITRKAKIEPTKDPVAADKPVENLFGREHQGYIHPMIDPSLNDYPASATYNCIGGDIHQKCIMVSDSSGVTNAVDLDKKVIVASGREDIPLDQYILDKLEDSFKAMESAKQSTAVDTPVAQSEPVVPEDITAFDLIELIPHELRKYGFYKKFIDAMHKRNNISDRYKYFINYRGHNNMTYIAMIANMSYIDGNFYMLGFHKVIWHIKSELRSHFATMKGNLYDDWFKLYCTLSDATYADIQTLQKQGKIK